MPLTLITGPANAAKAGAVLDRLRAARPRDPLLVVPRVPDVEHYQRELAASGLVFGAQVLTFNDLIREIARRARLRARPLGGAAAERVVRAAIADVPLRALARSAATPGFADAAARLFAELQRSLVTPARFTQALRAWAEPARAGYAGELAALYSAYRRRLEALGRPDRDGHAWAALDALRAAPAAWGGTPVFLYGFDDLSPVQRDAVETLVRLCETDVCLALPYEPGRAAFEARAATVEELRPLAAEVVHLPERSEHYAPTARPALHHLERSLFEPGAERRPPNGAVRLLEAGGERAEAELVGAEILELMRQGVAPDDIAVLLRGDAGTVALFAQVLAGYEIPVSYDRRVPFARTRLGAGVLAGACAALPEGRAADVVTWLRTPGRLAEPGRGDALDAHVCRLRLRSAGEARAAWEEKLGGEPLTGLDGFAAAAAAGPEALLAALETEAAAIFSAPHFRRGEVLPAEDHADARIHADLRGSLRDLAGLAAVDAELLGAPRELLDAVGRIEVRELGGADPAGVVLAAPADIRARRFRAVFVCDLRDGAFPRRPQPEPFLSDDDRRAIAMASGLVLPRHEDVLPLERSLFYAAVSRPEDALFLSWRSSDEEGEPLAASPFLEDVRVLFTDELWELRGTRLLADVTWEPREAPTPHELRRAYAAATRVPEPPPLPVPGSPAVLGLLAGRETEPARGIESFAACGVAWLVEQLLRPERIEPDPEPMQRGALAHKVLERTLTLLRERTGSAAIVPERLDDALVCMREAIRNVAEGERDGGGSRRAGETHIRGGRTVRRRALLRALEADVERYLRTEAECGAGYEPARLEWSFGGERDEQGPLALGPGSGVTGRVDRIDVGPDGASAIVRDYKGSRATAGARWTEDAQLQVPLYLLAVRELLGLEPVGGLYQSLWGRKPAARGLVRDDVPGGYVNRDVVDRDAFEAQLQAARELAARTAEAMHGGRIAPCPERCSSRGCRYPAVCRAGEPGREAPAA